MVVFRYENREGVILTVNRAGQLTVKSGGEVIACDHSDVLLV